MIIYRRDFPLRICQTHFIRPAGNVFIMINTKQLSCSSIITDTDRAKKICLKFKLAHLQALFRFSNTYIQMARQTLVNMQVVRNKSGVIFLFCMCLQCSNSSALVRTNECM
jgi:hypothetical protein